MPFPELRAQRSCSDPLPSATEKARINVQPGPAGALCEPLGRLSMRLRSRASSDAVFVVHSRGVHKARAGALERRGQRRGRCVDVLAFEGSFNTLLDNADARQGERATPSHHALTRAAHLTFAF